MPGPWQALHRFGWKAFYGIGGALVPGTVGRIAFDRFCTPGPGRDLARDSERGRARAEAALARARPVPVMFDGAPLAVHRWAGADAAPAPRPVVVLVHGWTGDALSMIGFVEPLRRAGFDVVAYDGPAHGRSPGIRTSLPVSAKALAAVAAAVGPVHGLVGHSFGAMVSALAVEGGPPLSGAVAAQAVVLIGAPNRLEGIVDHFCGRTGLAVAARRAMESRIVALAGRPIVEITTAGLLKRAGCRGLVVHDRDDAAVSIGASRAIVDDNPHLTLLETEGLGHQRPLFTRSVWKATVGFLREPNPNPS